MPIDINSLMVDKDSPLPLYHQLKQRLQEKIIKGELLEYERIPTEMAFVEALGVSRSTVRQAMDDLVNDGYLTREKGRGTFVLRPKIDEGFFQKLDSFNHEMLEKGMVPGTRVISAGKVLGLPDINMRLSLDETAPLYYLSRLRLADGEPIVYLETWLPHYLFASLEKVDFSKQSLYQVLEEQMGKKVEKAVRKIEAVGAKPAEARILGIKAGDPVCLVRSTAFFGDGTPVEYSIARYRGDRNQFTVELVRSGN